MEKCQRFVQQCSGGLVGAFCGKDRIIELCLLFLQFSGHRASDMVGDASDRHGLYRDFPYGGQLADKVFSQVLIRGEQINVTSLEDASGQVTLFVGQGQVLVDRNVTHQLTGVANAGNSGLLDVEYQITASASVDITSVISSGRLKGLLDARDVAIPDVRTQLDTLASNVVTEVNTQHRVGFGLDGSTALDFFTSTGLTARTIAVSLTDGRKIAASGTAAGLPGNNVNALALAGLQYKAISALGNATLNGYYQTTASAVGADAQQASQDLDAQQMLQNQLEAHWSEVSGVSLDEELVNMMTYQRAFEASSRIVVMADEMMQTILNLKR